MSAMLKNRSNESIGPSYFIKFKDGVVLPAVFKDGVKRPVLAIVINGEKKIIQPWNGKILYDMETGAISGNDGEISMNFLKDISYPREVTVRYIFNVDDLKIPLDIDYLHYYIGSDFKPGSKVDYFGVKGKDGKSLEIDVKLASIIATIVNALDLSGCRAYRRKTPNAEEVFIKSLRDVTIDVLKS